MIERADGCEICFPNVTGNMTDSRVTPALDSFLAHDDPVNHIAFAENGRMMASADTAMNVKVWRGRELIRTYDLKSASDKVRPTERIRGLRFASDGERLIIAAGEDVSAFKVSAMSDEPEWRFIAPRLLGFLVISPTSIAVSPKGTVAAAFDNGMIATWEDSLRHPRIIRHNAVPRTLQFLPDETMIGTDSFSVSLWRAGERKPVWHRASTERIYGMAASWDGKHVALRRLYSTVVYEIPSGAVVEEYRQGRGLPLVAFAPGTTAMALGTQHAINLHDVASHAHARFSLDEAELISLTFLPDGCQVVAGCSDGRIRVWDNPFWERSGRVERRDGP